MKTDDINRMIDERINNSANYKFSRNWHIGEFRWQDQHKVYQWCTEEFGPMPYLPDAWSRWKTMPGNSIAFRDEGDYLLFILRWL